MTSISWTDDGDDFVLASPRPTPADRFWEFVPDYQVIGPRKTTLGDRKQHVFSFREDYSAKFAIRHLSGSATQLLCLALKRWLIAGGEVTVTTDDGDTAVYEDLTLKPDTTPEITNEDEQRVHFAFRCELASDDPITVDYS
jgi:hypothetical protein